MSSPVPLLRKAFGPLFLLLFVLSGALFTDRLFAELVSRKMKRAGLTALHHMKIPPDESGLCVGQAFHAGLSD